MTRLVRRYPSLGPLLTVAAGVLGAALALACAAALGGCGAGAHQRAVSAVAVAAVEADRANAEAYRLRGMDAMREVEANPDPSFESPFGQWCRAMHDPWIEQARAECAILALADLAVAGQALIDSDLELNAEWIAVGCGTLGALVDSWSVAEAPPAALSTARAIVCALADVPAEVPACEVPEVVPGCEEVP